MSVSHPPDTAKQLTNYMKSYSEINKPPLQKKQPITWGLYATVIWGVLVTVVYAAVQLLAMQAYVRGTQEGLSKHSLGSNEYNGVALSLSSFATLIICGLLLCGIIKLKKKAIISDYLATHKISIRQVFYWSLAALIFTLSIDSLTYLQGRPVVVDFMTHIYTSTSQLWLLCLALIITAPLFEELFFRGFLFTGLSQSRLGNNGAVIITSLAWSVIHLQYDLYGVFTIFITGLLLGVARVKTGSVGAPILMHALMNGIALIETAIVVAQ